MTREEAIGVLEDVRDAICENIPGSHPELDELKEAVQMAVNALEERKTGKWIIQDNPGTGWYRVVCSECDENVTSNIPMIGFFPHCEPLWDYCPNCGADMRKTT